MNKQTKETAEAILATPKASGYVVLATYNGKPKEQLDILGKLMAERFGVEGCKIITEKPQIDDVRGKTIIGSLVSAYLGLAAKEVIEVNTSGFFDVPARMIAQYTDEEKRELLKYPKSYKVVATTIASHEPAKAAAETM
tara:strand:+ start:4097 stop:4513 length:417 start_codon:yes stop_codon:yes gene_type:complete